jgi:multiple sugar transport system substrate-binding protein
MININFSIIGDPTPTLEKILQAFEHEHGIHVNLSSQTWDNAWHELILWSLYGEGPDVSQVGSTWAASLMGMNAVRPFMEHDIRAMGSSQAFLPQCWQSTQDPSSYAVSSLPWTAYTFVLAYRRDLFEQAGISPETAFLSAESLLAAARCLQEAGVARPWVTPVDPNHIDTLHFIASWVWASGGDFISPDGRHVAFNRPATVEAMTHYFELLRYSDGLRLPMGENAALDYFVRGEAAMTIVGCGIAYEWLRNNQLPPEFVKNIGFAPVPGVPWIGGDNLVIWKNARMTLDRERAALKLAAYLVQPAVQERYANGEDVALPSLNNSLNILPLQESSLTRAVIQSLRTGRSYTPVTLWGKVEMQLSRSLGEIGTLIVRGGDPVSLVRENVSTQVSWLELLLR